MTEWPDYSMTNSLQKLFMALGEQEIKKLFKEVERVAEERGMIYEEDDGTARRVPLLLRPRLISLQQKNYFMSVCRHMHDAFLKLSKIYYSTPSLQFLLPFTPDEHEWFMKYFPQDPKSPHTIIARWDANTNFSGKNWKASFHFLEVNGVGVGGLHYSPTSERIILEIVVNSLRQLDKDLKICLNDDVRQILLLELQSHLKSLGKRRCHIGLIQDDRYKGGPLDFIYLKKFYESQGIKAEVIDPRDLRVKNGKILGKRIELDILYRDSMLIELLDMEKEEGPLKAVRKAFEENLIVSGLAGEIDHKSAFEFFSNPEFEKYFSADEIRYFKHHIPWTRLIRETRTTDPHGKKVDLVPYAVHHKETLVLKPNRGFGGEGILIGSSSSLHEWESLLAKALQNPGSYAVQSRCAIRRKKFPMINKHGHIVEKSLNVVCGFIYSNFGLGILGRASMGNVVNVAQNGGMTTIMICENRK